MPSQNAGGTCSALAHEHPGQIRPGEVSIPRNAWNVRDRHVSFDDPAYLGSVGCSELNAHVEDLPVTESNASGRRVCEQADIVSERWRWITKSEENPVVHPHLKASWIANKSPDL